MKTLFITLIGILSSSISTYACSVSVNDLFQKNTLVGIAASELKLDLSNASSIAISDYEKNFSGAVGGGDCPTHLNTDAHITIVYKKNKTTCTASINVHRSIQMGEELVAGPYEAISSDSSANHCILIPRF